MCNRINDQMNKFCLCALLMIPLANKETEVIWLKQKYAIFEEFLLTKVVTISNSRWSHSFTNACLQISPLLQSTHLVFWIGISLKTFSGTYPAEKNSHGVENIKNSEFWILKLTRTASWFFNLTLCYCCCFFSFLKTPVFKPLCLNPSRG